MLRRIYDSTLSPAGTRNAETTGAGISFSEKHLGLLFTLFLLLLLAASP